MKLKKFFSISMSGMAYGLFATLIIGTIIKQIGVGFKIELLQNIGQYLGFAMGAGIGFGIGLALKKEGLALISLGAAGFIIGVIKFSAFKYTVNPPFNSQILPGDPLLIYLTIILAILFSDLILRRKTPIDIILVPLLIILLSVAIALIIGPVVVAITTELGNLVDKSTELWPIPAAMIIAVIMGIALTAPVSSAAIAISISLGKNDIAAGAALIGCSTQMIGFAIMSRKDNKVGEVISIAVGTSMLQFKNIIRKPIIWLPTIIATFILGPIGAIVFKVTTTDSGAGMGTAGLVGPITAFDKMGGEFSDLLVIVLAVFILPAVITYLIDLLFRKFNLINNGDLKL